ncbi:hypothetical protein FB451DRAFT_1266081 [Mycena latifolia]|nr:hypothetical protein FB451DRAFT_1266081 [Mycena latifolia]
MNYTVNPTIFADSWDFAVSQAYVACAEIFLYGVLLVLLATSTYLLYHKTTGGRRTLSIATTVMAILATAQLGIHIHATALVFQIFRFAVQGEFLSNSPRAFDATRLYTILYTVEDFLLVTNNAVTDSLFIYRCFMVWGRNFRVVVVPICMVLTTTVLGYISAYQDDYSISGRYIDYRAAFIMSVLTNVVLMALTAGRIWWIRRDARVLLESPTVHKYNTVIAIILESGSIYCLCVTIYVIFVSLRDIGSFVPLISILRGAMPQIMNIAPTLIIVRVGLGHSVEDTTSNRLVLPRLRAGGMAPSFTERAQNPSFVINIRAGCERDTEEAIPLEVLGKET